ncbi:Aquaporin-3 [Toxocara canis]|uniref:Aquaporin-3 n=1 Tax=Toxocara canis TaxID=6265 RepID=A0A0B2V6U9_TOXCA|nr:Aquaporin-3 [Toxocara canis]
MRQRPFHYLTNNSTVSSFALKYPLVALTKPTKNDNTPMDNVERLRSKFYIRSELIRCAIAEFFCTALLTFGGCSSSAQYVLSNQANNAWIGVNLGWGFALIFAVYGGFNISDALNNFDGGVRYVSGPLATAGIFATYPKDYLSVVGGITDQVIGTAFLCICVCLITDKNNKIPSHLQPLLIGLVVALIGMCIGMNSGYAINPARDLGPRLFTLCGGWGWEVFSYRNYKWFWIPLLGPMIGAVVGAWIYVLFLGTLFKYLSLVE